MSGVKNRFERTRRATACILVIVCGLFSLSQPSSAQNTKDESAAKLFEQGDVRNGYYRLYTVAGRNLIADIPVTEDLSYIDRDAKWDTVKFNKPSVPGWVSRDYVQIENDRAIVTASILNVRLKPSIQAKIFSWLAKGYRTKVLERKNGFVRVLLPADFAVAIRADTPTEYVVQERTDAEPVKQTEPDDASLSPAAGSLSAEGSLPPAEGSEPVAGSTLAELQHLIAPGDAISLKVFGEPDLSIENVRVPQVGRVSFPLIGPVIVVGKTTSQIEESVGELLSQGYVRNPRLSVTIFSYRPIFIRGAVQNTGAFPFTEGLTIAKAIALAGGSKNSAKPQGVSILRDGKPIREGLSIDSQLQISSGDVISISEEIGVSEDQQLYIYIHGEVATPGEYIYRRGLTVEKAIVLASGFSLRASKSKITITRYAGAADKPPTKLKRVKLYTPIEPGDIIDVGASWF